jgi:hypothetical protein
MNPDQMGPIVRNTPDGRRQLVHARWCLPYPFYVLKSAAATHAEKLRKKGQPVDMDLLLRTEPDRGITKSASSTSGIGSSGSASNIDA